MLKMKVCYMKYFVNGSIKGLTYDTEVKVDTLEEANKIMNWAHAHVSDPVKACAGPDYTVHCSRIVIDERE